MKAYLALVICLLAFPILAQSNDIDALAREFFRLNTPEASLKADFLDQIDMIAPYLSGMMKEEGLSAGSDFSMEGLKELFGFILHELDYDELERIGAGIISSQYSLDELIAINAFLKSSAGQAYIYNSRPGSNYLAQTMKGYFEEKAQDETWLMGLIMSLLANIGLEDGLETAPAPEEETWPTPAVADSSDYYGWDDYWDTPAPIDSSYWFEETPAPADTAAVSYDSWEDYWAGPPAITITMNGRFFERMNEIGYLYSELMPVMAQVYKWLDDYTHEYGGYPNELDWTQIDTVNGYDLSYDHDNALLKAVSNSSYKLPGIELIYYLNENSVWISVPSQR
ncbi:MAG TPA: DUF2059 domain-containing protein [Candidatus Cloacimonadota bacterium]|nr:DUF2059 domain-containing protein [Candidatus Cloacimonadota bacterium]